MVRIFETCKSCIDGGFTSVMIDGSHHSYENVALTKKVVEYAHARGVTVEGELGQLAGIGDDVNVSAENASYTNPGQVYDFVTRTGDSIDCSEQAVNTFSADIDIVLNAGEFNSPSTVTPLHVRIPPLFWSAQHFLIGLRAVNHRRGKPAVNTACMFHPDLLMQGNRRARHRLQPRLDNVKSTPLHSNSYY